MLSFTQAQQYLLHHKADFGTELVDLLASAGRVLAQEVTADRPLPPFNRVMMDGIAIDSRSFLGGQYTFEIEDLQAAGEPQKQLRSTKNCLEVMTGAVLPTGTDTVIRYEDCTLANGTATINLSTLQPSQHVHLQGADGRAKDILLQPGILITPAVIGLMASVGLAQVPVQRLPRVAVFSTGDELVDITVQPEPHQIRKSNVYMLAAALEADGIKPDLYHLPDQEQAMTGQLQPLLNQYDVLLFSGAISKGRFDFLPQVLQQLGLTKIIHEVAQRPGKPLLLGTLQNGAMVFGLPGNPVSTFVCYQLFFRRWLHVCVGLHRPLITAKLKSRLLFRPALTWHVPVQLDYLGGELWATPITSSGSGDLTVLLAADGLLTLPPDKDEFTEGKIFPVTIFRS